LSLIKDFEYIVVDDASSPVHRLEDLLPEFPFLKLKRVDPHNKFYLNPCIPYNMGIAEATGEFIILQSPECLHMGDILSYVGNNISINKYFVFSCYSLDEQKTKALQSVDFNADPFTLYTAILNTIGGLSTNSCESSAGRYNTWFAHSKYRPCMFNFLVALTAKDMKELGGFNEVFYDGHSYDDTEFSERVLKKKMEVVMIDEPYCLHQYHPSVLSNIPNFAARLEKNRFLYEKCKESPEYYTNNRFIK